MSPGIAHTEADVGIIREKGMRSGGGRAPWVRYRPVSKRDGAGVPVEARARLHEVEKEMELGPNELGNDSHSAQPGLPFARLCLYIP